MEEVESEEELDEDDKANDESSDDVSEDENIANFQSKMKLQSAQGEFRYTSFSCLMWVIGWCVIAVGNRPEFHSRLSVL